MPSGDRTGPMGMGPRTGRAAGFCTGFAHPGYANPSVPTRPGTGFGGGRRGWRHQYDATGMPGWARDADPNGAPIPQAVAPVETASPPPPRAAAEPVTESSRDLLERFEALQQELDEVRRQLERLTPSPETER